MISSSYGKTGREATGKAAENPREWILGAVVWDYPLTVQRDMNLIRQILFRIENHAGAFAPQDYAVEGYTADQVGYHVWLLGQAGLMKVIDVTSHGSSGPQAVPLNLTWEGHDFIDAARSETTWSQAMKKAKSVGGSLSFVVFKQLLESVIRSQLGL
jgi:hypothetical protein